MLEELGGADASPAEPTNHPDHQLPGKPGKPDAGSVVPPRKLGCFLGVRSLRTQQCAVDELLVFVVPACFWVGLFCWDLCSGLVGLGWLFLFGCYWRV